MSARILVIDDSTVTTDALVQGLSAAGYEVGSALDLAALDARLSEKAYDLVLVDVNMPEMFGDDVIEFLRNAKKMTAKMVLYSNLSEEELASKMKSSGADGFVSKNHGLEGVTAEVHRLLGSPPAEATPTPAPSPASAAPKAAAEGPARKKRVLIVDDSEMAMTLLEAELSSKGFEVTTADTADKATKIILKKQTRPDLVLLDVRMPNVNGEQFCRFIKSNSLFKGIKVLLCSGENPEELQRICRDAGADGYVAKDAILSKVLTRELT